MLEGKYKKRSFLKLPVSVDLPRLIEEYESIPDDAWASSYWGNVHCSVGMLLLRGGTTGTETDFYTEEIEDHPPLKNLPYISEIVGADGPFGGAKYAFMFRMLPNGVSQIHQDLREEWFNLYRTHIPIITNQDAVLISNDRSMHLSAGEVWTFDNQSLHGVVNGNTERVHLIFDVPLNDTMASRIENAEFHEGVVNTEHNQVIRAKTRSIPSYPGDEAMKKTIMQLKSYKWDNAKIAEFLNSRSVPTRTYNMKWTENEVSQLLPAIFM